LAKFGTVEVYEELAALLNTDPVWAEKGKKIDNSLVFDYTDPVNKAFFVRFQAGQLTDVRELASADAEPADFTLQGSPEAWRGLLEGTTTPMKAITGGQLKLKGNMMALMKEMKAFSHVMDSLAKIELT
jgi:alkyl sulfatase BDS1-like metallo-beta-lactamase superfamily hydrolase